MSTKICTKCLEEKPTDFFYRRMISKDGRHSHCIKCRKESSSAWHAIKKEENKDGDDHDLSRESYKLFQKYWTITGNV